MIQKWKCKSHDPSGARSGSRAVGVGRSRLSERVRVGRSSRSACKTSTARRRRPTRDPRDAYTPSSQPISAARSECTLFEQRLEPPVATSFASGLRIVSVLDGMPNWSAPSRGGGSTADILSSMADTSGSSGAFNPYDINVFNEPGRFGGDTDKKTGDHVGQAANWRVPRTHDRAAERQAAKLRHSSARSTREPSVNSSCSCSTVSQQKRLPTGNGARAFWNTGREALR